MHFMGKKIQWLIIGVEKEEAKKSVSNTVEIQRPSVKLTQIRQKTDCTVLHSKNKTKFHANHLGTRLNATGRLRFLRFECTVIVADGIISTLSLTIS